ncbi:hypothetical protein JRD59_20700, partial [Citrobacter freundii]|nr:hypothetical protein [Citrobacter freundii]
DKSCLKAQLDKAYGDAYICGDFNSAKVNSASGEAQNHNQDRTETDNTENEDN